MGMTSKQYHGFLRLLKELAEEKIETAKRDEAKTKEDVIRDFESITDILQTMLEDGN